MNRSAFYLSIFVLFPILFFLLKPVHVGDLSIWIALGRDSMKQWGVIRNDFYTFTATRPMVYPFGLSVLYGLLYKWGGLNFVIFLHALISGCWALIWWNFIHKNKQKNIYDIWNWRTLILFLIALVGASLAFTARPALVATVPFLIAYVVLLRRREEMLSKMEVLQLALLEIVWVNVHGSFLLLPAMLAWQASGLVMGRRWALVKNRVIALLVLLASSLMNPFGAKVFAYAIATVAISHLRQLDEWTPPQQFVYPFASWYFFIFSAGLLILLLRKMKAEKKWPPIVFDPLILIWISSFLAVRNTSLLFLMVPLFVYTHFQLHLQVQGLTAGTAISRAVNAAVILALCLSITALSPFYKARCADVLPAEFQASIDPHSHSEKIDNYLSTHYGRVFNDWEFGSDLALQQPNKYFIDIRNIIFSKQVNHEYDLFTADPQAGFPAIENYKFQFFMVDEKHQKLVRWLRSSSRFQEVLKDGPAILFATPGNPDVGDSSKLLQ